MKITRTLLTLSFLFLYYFHPLSEAKEKTFVYCASADPSGLNPQLYSDGATTNIVTKTIYSRLVELDQQSLQVKPGLAESWSISSNRKVITFKLRRDVQFHSRSWFKPSRHLNADDVLFSFHRQLNRQHPFHQVSGGNYPYINSTGMAALIEKIIKQDEYTVVFYLKRPHAPFLANMTMDFASIFSQEYAQSLNASQLQNIDTHPIGTGPYRFATFQRGEGLRFQNHPEYYLGAPPSTQLIVSIVTDSKTRLQKLKRGECHFIDEPPLEDLESISKDSNLKLISGDGVNLGFININTHRKPFDDPRVRRAVFLALNRVEYIKAVYQGHAAVAESILPSGIWSYQAQNQLNANAFNPIESQRLLADAGYKNGFEVDLWVLPVSRPYNPNGRRLGEMMQSDLKAVGIRVNLLQFEWGTHIKKLWAGEHTLAHSGWYSDNGDPDNFLYTPNNCEAVRSKARAFAWCEKKLDDLLLTAQSTFDIGVRSKLYEQAQFLFARDLPWIPIAQARIFKAASARIEGYTLSPNAINDLSRVYLK